MKTKVMVLCGLLLTLAGCQQRHYVPPQPLRPYANLTSSQQSLAARLRHNGIHVSQQGTKLWIVIPTDNYFAPGSTELLHQRINTLANVAYLVRSFRRSHPSNRVRVIGYNNPKLNGPSARSSSKPYADVIAGYLWNFGVARNVTTIVGNASDSPTGLVGDGFARRVVVLVQ